MVVTLVIGIVLIALISNVSMVILTRNLLEYKHLKGVDKTPENVQEEVEKVSEKTDNKNDNPLINTLMDNPDILDEYLNGAKEG